MEKCIQYKLGVSSAMPSLGLNCLIRSGVFVFLLIMLGVIVFYVITSGVILRFG